MVVGFDISPERVPGTGIANYTKNIREGITKENDLFDYKFLEYPISIKNRVADKVVQILWEQIILPILILFKGISLVHLTKNFGVPFIVNTTYITTIHDIIPYILKDQYLNKAYKRIEFALKTKRAIKHSKIIITDSHYTKKDLMKYFNVPDNKIEVLYLGVDSKFKKIEQPLTKQALKNKLGIEAPYILGIGGTEPRKNVSTLIQAFEQLQQKYQTHYSLVIVGRPWPKMEKENSVITQANNKVIYTGYIEDNELVSLYNEADLFVFPSLYEGFGLPPLEAMACGTPVIVSNTTSLPEIVGDAGYYIDPRNPEQISEAIWHVLSDASLRESLITKGFERVKFFNWDDSVNKIIEIYKKNI